MAKYWKAFWGPTAPAVYNNFIAFFEEDPNECLAMFCRQLKVSKKDVSSLRMTHFGELLEDFRKGIGLANLPTLTIDLAQDSSRPYVELSNPNAHYRALSSWFNSAIPRLKNLNIVQCWAVEWKTVAVPDSDQPINVMTPALDLLALFATNNVRFPALQTLHLQHVTTTASSLTKFLDLHRKTLVSLKIDRPCIDPKDWKQMKQKIEEEAQRGYYGPKSGCEVILTDAMTDPMGIDKNWKGFNSLIW